MSGDLLSIHDQAQPMRRDTLLGAARQRRENSRAFVASSGCRARPDATHAHRRALHVIVLI
jgi:hypothetical protein